jgi:hypothetical protein
MNQEKACRQAVVYFAVTLGAVYFIFWGPLALLKIPTISFVSDVRGPGWAIALFMAGGFTPSITAIILTGLWEGRNGLRRMGRRLIQFNIGWRWYLAVLGMIALITMGEVLVTISLGHPFDLSLFFAQLGSFIPLIIIGPLSEELGWRGYAQDRLQTRFHSTVASLIIGILWSLWHLPLFFIVGTSQYELGLPFLPFLLSVTSLSVLMGWVYNSTQRSLWSAILVHWIYTYSSQVISTGFTETPTSSWLRCIPYILVAALVVVIWRSAPQPIRPKVAEEI